MRASRLVCLFSLVAWHLARLAQLTRTQGCTLYWRTSCPNGSTQWRSLWPSKNRLSVGSSFSPSKTGCQLASTHFLAGQLFIVATLFSIDIFPQMGHSSSSSSLPELAANKLELAHVAGAIEWRRVVLCALSLCPRVAQTNSRRILVCPFAIFSSTDDFKTIQLPHWCMQLAMSMPCPVSALIPKFPHAQ